MRIRAFLCCLVLCLSLILPNHAAFGASGEDEWLQIEPGIDYREFLLDGPNRVFVARMNRSQENVILDTSIGQGRLAYGAEKVSGMAARYDEAINFWDNPTSHGFRNNVVVAINGSFVNPGTSVPYSGVIQSGWYAKRYDNLTGVSFGWKAATHAVDRKAYISDCVYNEPSKQYVKFTKNNYTESIDTISIDGVNIYRPADSLVLYSYQFDRSTWTASDGMEVLVELNRPSMILSEPRGARGNVVGIRDPGGSTLIPFDHIVLSAHGTAAEKLRPIIAQYNENETIEIEISQELKSYVNDCNTYVPEPDWNKTYAGITGDHTYLANGIIFPHPTKYRDVHPRTAIAFNDSFIYFIVVDGRQPGVSVGMTYTQLGEFSTTYLQAHTGMALDGGGSSTMVVNDKVVNKPSDPCHPYYLPLLGSPRQVDSSGQPVLDPVALDNMMASSVPPSVCERHVGSGVMMIVLQPNEPSITFTAGDTVLTQSNAQLRLGPGTNYALMATITAGQEGAILHHSNGLDGVYAKGKHWWKVSFGSVTGWVSEESLIQKPSSGTPN